MESTGNEQFQSFCGKWRELLERPGFPELFLVLLTSLVYARSLTMGFVYDDHEMINSPSVLGWKDIPRIFSDDLPNTHWSNFYRPIAVSWQILLRNIAGTNPTAWHLSAIALYLLCVVLVFRLACRLLESKTYATLAAAIFALHPTHVEVVTWISDTAELLLAVILLLSALAFLRWLQTGSAQWWIASWLLATACCFVKETGIFAPLLLLPLAFKRARRVSEPAIALTSFFLFLSSCGFLILRNHVLHGFAHPLSTASNFQMALTVPLAICFYLAHLLFPFKLGPFYPLAFVSSPRSLAFVGPVLILAALLAILIWCYRHLANQELLGFCVAWVFVPLIAPLYLKLFADFELVHDRYLYLPTVALGIAVAALLKRLSAGVPDSMRHSTAKYLHVATIVVLAALAAETISYQGVWQDDAHLFQRGVELTPRNARALVNLGVAKLQQGKLSEGSALLERSLAIQPDNAFALFDLGNAALNRSDTTAAESYIRRAVALESHANWWVTFASLEFNLGKLPEAEWAARQAIAIDPVVPGAHFVVGAVRLAQHDPATAVHEIGFELRLNPGNISVQQALQVAREQLAKAN